MASLRGARECCAVAFSFLMTTKKRSCEHSPFSCSCWSGWSGPAFQDIIFLSVVFTSFAAMTITHFVCDNILFTVIIHTISEDYCTEASSWVLLKNRRHFSLQMYRWPFCVMPVIPCTRG